MAEEDERRELDDRWMVPAIVAVAAILRILAVIGQQAFVYVDSIDYETLDFSGGARRPWVTPLLYGLTDHLPLRILLQAAIGAACWTYLAVVASRLPAHRWVRVGTLASILGLSLTTTVTNWDTAMLSESLALSWSAFLVGALLRVAQLRSYGAVVVALVAWLLWIFTRQNHLVLGGLVVTALGVVLAVQWRRTRTFDRVGGVLLGGVAALTVVALFSYRENTEIVDFNLATVIGGRVLTDPDQLAWFLDEGMPVPTGVPTAAAASPEQLLADPAFESWLHSDGVRTYARFLVSHPWSTLTGPLDSFVSDRPPFSDPARADEALLASADGYGVGRHVLPEPVEDVLFQPGSAGTIVFALVLVAVLTARRWQVHGPDPRWLVPLLALLLQWPALTAVWHASVAELGRLALPSAVILRIAVLLQLALLVDAWLADRQADETYFRSASPLA
jgi:hypothetical protein